MNYKLSLSYNGSKYHGWAIQSDVDTIHGTINDTIVQLLNIKPVINASGRTDAYVHAVEQIINMKHPELNLSAENLMHALNSQLLPNIRINSCEIVDDNFHARYDCKNKTYNYLIETNPKFDVMQYEHIYQYNKVIDDQKIKQIIPLFIGNKNFLSFSTSELENCIRQINSIELTWYGSILSITVNGNGFLRNMVRMIVGVFLAYNDDKISIAEIEKLFEKPTKGSAKFKAYACGLYLEKVNY